nr:hypothetical protein [Elizabethkingia sp. ASV34]
MGPGRHPELSNRPFTDVVTGSSYNYFISPPTISSYGPSRNFFLSAANFGRDYNDYHEANASESARIVDSFIDDMENSIIHHDMLMVAPSGRTTLEILINVVIPQLESRRGGIRYRSIHFIACRGRRRWRWRWRW